MSIAQVKGFSKASILLFNKKQFFWIGNTRVLRYKLAAPKRLLPARRTLWCSLQELGTWECHGSIDHFLIAVGGGRFLANQAGWGVVIHHRRFWQTNKAIVRNHHIREEIHPLKWVIFCVNLPECSWNSKSWWKSRKHIFKLLHFAANLFLSESFFGVKLALMSNKNWVRNLGISGLVKYDQLDLPPPSKDATVTPRSDDFHF